MLLVAARSAAEKKKDSARAGLIDFACYVDPAYAKWYRAKHLRVIADALERLQRREITRLILNIPPRHLKSSIVLKLEAKLLGDNPNEKIINASRAQELANKFSKQVRRTIESERYKALYPNTRIARGYDRADDWLLEGGYSSSYRAVGTGGGIAGEGATFLVLEDVSDPNKQQSVTETDNDWDWYKNVARTRLEANGVIAVVNNRTSPNDITGHLLDPERNDSADPPHVWTVINMPAYDEVTGEYLWLDRFGLEYYLSLQNDPVLWRVQYQQQPTISEGNVIKREWFEYVPHLPEGTREQWRYYDLALTLRQVNKNDPDYTAEVGGTKHNDLLYLVNPRMYRAEVPQIVTNIMAYKLSVPYVRMGMGKALHERAMVQTLAANGYPIEGYLEKGDLLERLSGFINLAASGRVKLVGTKEQWGGFMEQWCAIPNGTHDDAGAVVAGVVRMAGMSVISYPKRVSEPSPYKFVESM